MWRHIDAHPFGLLVVLVPVLFLGLDENHTTVTATTLIPDFFVKPIAVSLSPGALRSSPYKSSRAFNSESAGWVTRKVRIEPVWTEWTLAIAPESSTTGIGGHKEADEGVTCGRSSWKLNLCKLFMWRWIFSKCMMICLGKTCVVGICSLGYMLLDIWAWFIYCKIYK